MHVEHQYSKPVLSSHPKRRPKIGFQDIVSLNAGQKAFAIFSTFIKLPFEIKMFPLFCLFLSGP